MVQRVTSPQFIGRENEVEALAEALGRAAAGIPSTVLVGGEAGIGKTRLLGQLAERARGRRMTALEGACVSFGTDEGLPFAPIAAALRALVRDLGREGLDGLLDESTSELARLVPELGGKPDESPWQMARPDWAQTRLFEGLLTLLGRVGERAPAVLVLEDLHWADRSTREILAFLARNARHERIAFVATYRTDELHRRHPLRPWLAEMDRLASVRRIELPRFDRDELRRQIEAIVGGPAEFELVDSVARRSSGNPFFAEELVACCGATPGGPLPGELRDVLLARVQTMSDDAQEILGIAAVSGPAIDHDLLAAVAARPEAELTAAIRESVEAQLLVPVDIDGVPAYAFRHALVQEAVYDDLLPRDRRAWHAGFAAALRARSVPEGAAGASQLAALAHHATAAHDVGVALAAWIDAARASSRAYAMAEAARAYEHALDLWDAVGDADRPAGVDPIQLMYEASMALIHTGDSGRAAEIARLAVERFDVADDPLRAAMLRERQARALWLSADLPGAIRVLDEAVGLLAGAPPSVEAARVLSGLAGILMVKDQFTPAAAYAAQAIEMARMVGARDVEAYSLNTLGIALAELGDGEEGLHLLRQSMTLTREIDRAHDVHRVFSNLSTALQDLGRPEEAVEVASEGVRWARHLGMWRLQGSFLEANASSALTDLGRWDEAWAMLDRDDDPATEGVGRLNRAVTAVPLAIWTGRTDAALRLLQGIYDVVQRLRDAQFTGAMYAGMVELALVEGRLDDVRRLVAEGLDRMSDTEDIRRRAELLALAIRAEAERATLARLHRRARAEADAAAAGRARLADLRDFVARTAEGRGPLGRLARAFLAIGEAEAAALDGTPDPDAWGRAVGAWRVIGHPYRIAWCIHRFVQASLATRAAKSVAADALREAHDLATGLGAAPLVEEIETLARIGRIDLAPAEAGASGPDAAGEVQVPTAEGRVRPFGLTARELDVLRQLVGGLSNRQIGDALFISESTAGVHVSNILAKLGVTSRVEAAAIAVRSGLAE